MSQEVDPAIGKGVKLLLSNDENSTEELRAHLEEQIRVRYGSRRAQGIASLSPNSEFPMSSMVVKRRPATPGSDDSSPPSRKMISIESGNKSSSNSPIMNYDSESSGADSEDLTLEILEENLCIICKGVQTTSRNRFVECTDCHNLYHQNCATPPIEADVTDPRFVWYCDNCRKGSSTSNKLGASGSSCSSSGPGSSGNGSSVVPLSPPTSGVLLGHKVGSPVATSSSTAPSNSGTGANNSVSNSAKASSAPSGSGVSKPSVGATRSQNTSYTLVNKPLGGKFRLLKTVRRF